MKNYVKTIIKAFLTAAAACICLCLAPETFLSKGFLPEDLSPSFSTVTRAEVTGAGTKDSPWVVDSWGDLQEKMGVETESLNNQTYPDGVYIQLKKDCEKIEDTTRTDASYLHVKSDSKVHLDLNGVTVDRNLGGLENGYAGSYSCVIFNEGNLTIEDSSGEKGTDGYDKGRITGAVTSSRDSSGGIYNFYGTLNICSGTIVGNVAKRGGGIYNWCGTVTISGGYISGNTAVENFAGGIYNHSQGTIIISGGYISDNKVDTEKGAYETFCGGGIVNNGTMTMTGGCISGNTVSGDNNLMNYNGGGVYNIGTMTMTGGYISNNTAKEDGGGVYNEGIVKFFGGHITDNTSKDGGGIYSNFTNNNLFEGIDSSEQYSIKMTGGYISNNSAKENGGGICNKAGKCKIEDGYITDNTSLKGGGIYQSSSVKIEGGYISDNLAMYGGGIL